MAVDDSINRFLETEKQASLVLKELEKLKEEIKRYSSAADNLNLAFASLSSMVENIKVLTEQIQDVVGTLRVIGTPELMNASRDAKEELVLLKKEVQETRRENREYLKAIAEFKQKGLFTKLFGSG